MKGVGEAGMSHVNDSSCSQPPPGPGMFSRIPCPFRRKLDGSAEDSF